MRCKQLPEQIATPADIAALIGKTSEADIAEQDALLKVYRSRATLSPEKRKVARGIELERLYYKQKKWNALAEALGMQGRFAEAAEIATDEAIKAAMAIKAEAIEKADIDCACPTFTETNGYLIPNQHVIANGYSVKHGQVMPFIRCTICGDVNARPLPQHLADQHAVRNDPDVSDADRLNFFKLR
jgi:hypothetical protein